MKKLLLVISILSLLLVGCDSKKNDDFEEVSKVDVEVSDYVEDSEKSTENSEPINLDDTTQNQKVAEKAEAPKVNAEANTEEKKEEKKETTPVKQQPNTTSTQPAKTEVKQEKNVELSSFDLSGKVICIDAAHGDYTNEIQEPMAPNCSINKAGNTKCTVGKTAKESDITLSVANKVKSLLESRGAKVLMTRESTTSTMTNKERAEFANNNGAMIVVKLHADGAGSKKSGMSVLTPGGGYIFDNEMIGNSYKLGKLILKNGIVATSAKNNGISYTSNMTGLNWSKVPAIIFEMGYLTNPADELKLSNSNYQDKIAIGIANGIIEYYK